MANAMTPERLAEIRRYATRTRTVKELLAERDRLAAENERLMDALKLIAGMPGGAAWAHIGPIVKIARDALKAQS